MDFGKNWPVFVFLLGFIVFVIYVHRNSMKNGKDDKK